MTKKRKSLIAVVALILALITVYITGFYYSSSTIPNTPDAPDEESDQLADSAVGTSGADSTVGTTEEISETQTENSPEPSESEYTFVVPEIPLGTLGAFSALASSFGTLVLSKRAK